MFIAFYFKKIGGEEVLQIDSRFYHTVIVNDLI